MRVCGEMIITNPEVVHHDSSNVTMETGKPGLANVPLHISSVEAQTEKRMDIQAPLTAVYIHTVPALPVQPYIQPPAIAREPSTLHLAMPPLYSKETLPFVTLRLAGGLQPQPRLSLSAVAPTAKPKSAGKHVCPHCGRDCMKPSVLEKHLRCHTGERPYPCTTCGVSFKTQSNLYKHRRTQAHARLSSESEQSSQGSLDSMSSSRETCNSSLSLDEHTEESGSIDKTDTPPASESSTPVSTTKAHCVQTKSSVSEQKEPSLSGHNAETRSDVTKEEEKLKTDTSKQPSTVSRHLPLQRQQATSCSEKWGSSGSRGKSQSHESTDSGFSESSDHYFSPSCVLPDHSLDSLTESSKEHPEESWSTCTSSDKDQSEQGPKQTASKQEQKMLAERISKLISENTAVVEDKQLENVRPRKTVLSKQGSIDLPMPYTYKDSFHFDMRINPSQNTGLKKNSKPILHSAVPTQCTSTQKHNPLTRSNSLPFSITLMQPERNSPAPPNQGDYVTVVRRGSSGQINPTDLVRKPVNQHSSAHHPLVRQTAVDCNHATDSLFINSSVEEACISSLSCDGDVGDICGEPNIRKFRRKKAQKFAYNKWYMYGGGTFKKLYDPDKNVDNITFKGRKCSANSQQDVVQGLQKRVSVVQKEAVSTSTSTISGATGGHNAASHVSSVDLNLHRCLSSTNSSIKAPLRRNLSLSFLPVPTTGPPVGHKTECLNRTEAGRLIDVPKQTDSTWQLCGAHVPSDRKKLRTDDKIGSSIEMETDPNMPIHPPSSVACSVSQHDTNIACVHAQRNPNPNELKGALLLPHILNANVPPVSTSPASSTHVAAKNTFLPKYQLKLPNNCDAESNVSLQVVGKSKETESSSLSDQTLPSGTMCVKAPVSSPSIQTCESSRMKTSTQDQLVLPCIVTSICQGEQSLHTHLSASSLAVVQRQFATTTKTTSCLQDYSGGLCSTLIHPLKPAMAPMPVRLHQPLPPAAVNFSLTTASNQMLASTITAVSHHQPYLSPNLPLAHTQLSTVSDKAQVGLKTPVLSRPTVPLNQSAQNVFHVQTEDLQICFQIISDEQLALIERASGTSLSQMSNAEAATPEVSLSKAQSVTVEMSNGGGGHELPENQKQTVGRGSCPSVNTQRKTPPESEAAHNLRERSDTSEVSAISIVSQGLFQQHERRGHVSMVTQRSAGCSISTAASLGGVTSGGIQILENQQAICLNCGAEGQFSLDRRVSQSGMDTLMFSGRFKLSSDSTSTENQKNTNQHKHHEDNHGDLYNTDSLKTSRNVFTDKDSELEGGQCLRDTSREICIKDSVSTDTCKTSRPLTQQTSICCSPQTVSALNTSQNSSRQSHSSSSSLGEPLHDGTSTEHLEMCQGQFTSQSSNIQRERPEDVPAVCTSIQSTTTGLVEGTALMQRAAQKEQQMQECAETPAQPEITDWRPTQSNMEAETNHQVLEEQNLETMSACRLVVPSDLKLQEKETKVDSFKGSCLSEQQLQCSSQTQSGMSEYLPPAPQQTQTTSHNSMVSAVNTHTSLLNSPPLEINQLQPPLKNWDSSIARNQQQVFPEFSSGRHAQVQLLETQIKPELHSSSHQTQTCTGVSAQPAHTSAGNYRTAVSHQDFLISESSRNTSFSSSYRALPSMQFTHVFQESRTTSGLMGKTQTSVNNRNTESLSNPFAYLELDEKQNATSTTPYDQTSPSSNSGRLDTTNKYQSLFLVESFHGYQPAECLTGGVRPVAICQDYTEDTSSSDDEGKLIIELK